MVRFPRRTSAEIEVVPPPVAPDDDESPRRRTPSLAQLLDASITLPSTLVHTQVDRLRAKHPDATPADVIVMLERRYLLTVTGTGGAVGAAAALPAVGTGTALALTTSQVGTFLATSAGLALAVADVHGVQVDDVARRRTLVLASLLGEQGSVIVEEEVGVGTLFWARSVLARLPLTTVKTVNRTLARRMARYGATRGGTVFFGRLAPFGIGAVIGATGGRAMGNTMIKGVRRAFGPAPATFARPLAIGAEPIGAEPIGAEPGGSQDVVVLGEALVAVQDASTQQDPSTQQDSRANRGSRARRASLPAPGPLDVPRI